MGFYTSSYLGGQHLLGYFAPLDLLYQKCMTIFRSFHALALRLLLGLLRALRGVAVPGFEAPDLFEPGEQRPSYMNGKKEHSEWVDIPMLR